MDIIDIKTKIIIGLVLTVGLTATHGYVGYKMYKMGQDVLEKQYLEETIRKKAEHETELADQRVRYEDSVVELNKKLSDFSATVKVINKTVEKEIEKPVYINTIVPASGLHLLANTANELNSKRIPIGTFSPMSTFTSAGKE